jgi:hypothetical protein
MPYEKLKRTENTSRSTDVVNSVPKLQLLLDELGRLNTYTYNSQVEIIDKLYTII